MSAGAIGPLVRSARHTRPAQLYHRLRLQLLRRIRRTVPPSWVALPATPLAVRTDPPLPLLPPRTELVAGPRGARELRMLHQTAPLVPPVDWRVPSMTACRPLAILAVHYLEFLEALDDDELLAFSEEWIDRHPPYRGTFWLSDWNSYAVSIRCVVWMQQLAARWTRLPEDGRSRLACEVARQMRFLVANLELDLGGNHLIKNIKALLWAARFFEGEEASAWGALGQRLLRRELSEQILADGTHFERSPAYHCQVFVDLLECYQVSDGDTRQQLAAVLPAMAQVLVDLTHPDDAISLFNDGGLHMTWHPATCLELYDELIGPRPTPRRVFALSKAGFFGLRDGDRLLVTDMGPVAPDHLPAHGHGDIGSFEWTIGGQRIIVDHGVYEYTPGAWRERSRATRMHNTLTLDDADQCEFWSSFRMGRRAHILSRSYRELADGFELDGEHDGYHRLAGAPRHRRRLRATAGGIEIDDIVEGGRGQRATIRFLLHPDARATVDGDRATITCAELTISVAAPSAVRLVDAYWCPDFGVAHETTQLEIDIGTAPCRGRTTLTLEQQG